MSDKKNPSPEEIQKEFEEFVKDRFGGKVQIINHEVEAHAQPFNEQDSDSNQENSEEQVFDLDFDLVPKEVKAYLDRFVVKQDEAKKALAIAVCDHYNQVSSYHHDEEAKKRDYSKQNVLILGPTGVGKTYMIKQIAKLIGVPFVKADATRFSETGYMGANVDDLIRDLVHQADDNIEMAQFGIIYLDEADKLAVSKQSGGRDVSGRGVQFGMLKLMEETEVDLRSGNDPASQMQAMMEFQKKGKVEKQIINTRHILFIVSGAFTGLEQIINKRMDKKVIGFNSSDKIICDSDKVLHQATTQDFVDFGFEPEFVGRLPVRVACDHLKAADLFDVLKNSEGSIVKQYEAAFDAYGIEINFTDDALVAISKLAESEKTGARALMTVCEKIFRDFKFELPSTGVSQLTITKELIDNPEKVLKELLKLPNSVKFRNLYKKVSHFEEHFSELNDLNIEFTDKAKELICSLATDSKITIHEFLETTMMTYEHGLKLVQQNTGTDTFILDTDMVENPKLALELLIKSSYETKIIEQPTEQSSTEELRH
jgi:endopeptidase Clp ATP-binding regulatory subunit ClpX